MLGFGLTACGENLGGDDNGGNGGNDSKVAIAGEWGIVSWNGAEPVFDIYVDFNEDGTFEMYQQVYSLTYELFTGHYVADKGVINGSYSDGSAWKCSYKYTVDKDEAGVQRLTLDSEESIVVTSVYTATEIPAEVKAEASETRAMEVEPFL